MNTLEITQNKVAAVNVRAEYLNAVVPLINERLEKGTRKKDDGTFYKKDHDDLKAILESVDTPSWLRVYIDAGHYSDALKCDVNFRTGDHGCSYSHTYVYLGGGFEPIKLSTVEEIELCRAEYKRLDEEAKAIFDKMNKLKRIIEV